jgi:hypothetical protein
MASLAPDRGGIPAQLPAAIGTSSAAPEGNGHEGQSSYR